MEPGSSERSWRALVARWALPAVWLSLPFTLGPALADALAGRDDLVQHVDSSGLWLVWLAGLVSTIVASSVSLTGNRVLGPAALVAAISAVLGGASGAGAIIGILIGTAAALLSLNRAVADRYVNGSSYGDERRFVLRTPAPLLLGPVELAVIVIIAGTVGGPMLLAARLWIVGTIALVVGWPLAYLLARALHGLSRRWLVFVPVGVVLHDYSVLIDSLLVARKDLATIGWAEQGTDALDLTAGGLGRVLQLTFRAPESLLLRPPRRPGTDGPALEPTDTAAILVAPARGKAALAEAVERRIAVTR